MRKKLKRILPLLVLVLGLILLSPFNTEADSGWDGSYDSGSSSSDWGSSSSSDWGSSSSSDWGSSSSYDDNSSSSKLSIEWFLIIILIIILVTITTQKTTSSNNSNNKYDIVAYPDENIKEILPDFDREKFFEQAFELYKNIQEAWMNFDYDMLRKNTTDELYNTYNAQLTVLKTKKQKNIMKDFKLLAKEIVGMEHNENSISLKVRMIIECIDYVIDKDEKIVRGSNNKVQYDYEMTFIKGLGKENKCPNCGAELEANSNKCLYCRATIVSDTHDFVLSKKQVISQTRKKYTKSD